MACVASSAVIVRIPYLPAYGDPDFLYATTDISIWSNVEAGLGIAAGSLVTVRPLFRWFTGSTYTGTYSSSSNNRKYGSNYPLSSMGGNASTQSRHDPNTIHYWRRDLIPENSRAVVVTTHDSQNSSQESLHPGQSSAYPPGVNVHKSFHVSSEQT
ncbi:putative cation-transporting ATPase 1 [Elasticomyces elasticus]|nr:putative cation-transporting ATPase 1 [Elasticomyces elasticus]